MVEIERENTTILINAELHDASSYTLIDFTVELYSDLLGEWFDITSKLSTQSYALIEKEIEEYMADNVYELFTSARYGEAV